MKKCSICGEVKTLSEFYKNCKSKDGYLSHCKICSEAKKKKRLENPEYAEKVRQQRAKGHARNREHRNKASREQYAKNREERCAAQRQYHEENKEARKAYNKSARAMSRETARRYREKNWDHVWAVNKAWRLKNKDKLSKNGSRRRAAQLRAIPSWADDEWESFLVEEMYHLAKVRKESTGMKYHVDHIVPLQSDLVCGLHCSANMQLLLASENISKSNRYWPDMPLQSDELLAMIAAFKQSQGECNA